MGKNIRDLWKRVYNRYEIDRNEKHGLYLNFNLFLCILTIIAAITSLVSSVIMYFGHDEEVLNLAFKFLLGAIVTLVILLLVFTFIMPRIAPKDQDISWYNALKAESSSDKAAETFVSLISGYMVNPKKLIAVRVVSFFVALTVALVSSNSDYFYSQIVGKAEITEGAQKAVYLGITFYTFIIGTVFAKLTDNILDFFRKNKMLEAMQKRVAPLILKEILGLPIQEEQ